MAFLRWINEVGYLNTLSPKMLWTRWKLSRGSCRRAFRARGELQEVKNFLKNLPINETLRLNGFLKTQWSQKDHFFLQNYLLRKQFSHKSFSKTVTYILLS